MKRNRRKILKWSGIVLAALLLGLLAGAWSLFDASIKAAGSIEKLEPGLYAMEYTGDYGLEDFLAEGGAKSDRELADYLVSFLSHGLYKTDTPVQTGSFGCSTVGTWDENGSFLFGRNYDWEECQAIIVHTKPKDGYESLSTCCLDFLGFGEDFAPDGSLPERMKTLAAVYVPLDGMNDQGLVVADLIAGDREATHQDTGKADLTTTTAIRLLLDRAANVEQAIDLLQQYDMHSSMDYAHHLSIADASGRSVAVEYVKGEMIVTEARVVTNHYLAPGEKQGVGSEQSHLRYETLAAHTEPADAQQLRDLLECVAQKNYPQNGDGWGKTMWSIVYSPAGRCADFYFSENYRHSYGLILCEKDGFVKR